MTESDSAPARHAFLSYVSEDSERVDQLEAALAQAGVTVWRDKNDIGPGLDWRVEIRRAIMKNSLAFVACFSESSSARSRSYQFEELALAVSEFRQLPPEQAWIFPVRFADVELPYYDLGPNKDLDSLHRTDLFGANRDRNLVRLLQTVSARLEVSSIPSPRTPKKQSEESRIAAFRRLIRDPQGDLALEELVDGVVDEVILGLGELNSEKTSPNAGLAATGEFLVRRTQAMETVMAPLLELAVQAGIAGTPEHRPMLKNISRAVAAALPARSGQQTLLDHNRYPTLLVMYGVALASVLRENWGALKTVAIEAKTKVHGASVPLVGYASGRKIFADCEWIGTAVVEAQKNDEPLSELLQRLSVQRGGWKYTPVSDHLQWLFRPYFAKSIRDDAEYVELFDRTEVMLDLLTIDAVYNDGSEGMGWLGLGSYTWRNRYSESPLLLLEAEFETDPENWAPLLAGLFDRDENRARHAFSEVRSISEAMAREQRFQSYR